MMKKKSFNVEGREQYAIPSHCLVHSLISLSLSHLFQSTSTFVKLHQRSLTHDARQRSVASKWERTSTATSGGSWARSGKLSLFWVREETCLLLQEWQEETCPIIIKSQLLLFLYHGSVNNFDQPCPPYFSFTGLSLSSSQASSSLI